MSPEERVRLLMLFKNLLKKVRGSMGRYISIMAIVFIGAGVFAGLASSAPDMVRSADAYYKDTNLMDFKIVSTMGLTDDDVTALKQTAGVDSVYPSYSLDVLDHDHAIKIHAIEEGVNGHVLKSGREPKAENECLADDLQYKVGDTVEITSDVDGDLKNTKFTVVGTIQTPLYLSSEGYGNTNIGDGKVFSFAFVPRSNFTLDVYTEIYVCGTETATTAAYSAAYHDAADALDGSFVAMAPTREKTRHNEIVDEAQEKVDTNQAKVDKNQKKLDREKAKGEKKLADAKRQLDSGSSELASSKKELASSETKLKEEMAKQEKTFASAEKKIDGGWNQIDAACKKMGTTRKGVPAKIKEVSKQIAQLEAALAQMPDGTPGKAKYEAQLGQLQALYAGLVEVEGSITTLSAQEKKLNAGIKTYDAEIAKAQAQIARGKQEIRANEAKLRDGYAEYYDGVDEFKTKIADAQTKLADAQKKLDKAQKKVDDIEMPVWHIYNRDNITGYEAFKSATEVISAITTVFPIFFVLIVMLMTSNTMARMIVEERGELGTLRSLGYGDTKIMSTYLVYVLSASVLGGVIGYYLGATVIPTVIFGAFRMFIAPPLTLFYDWWMLGLILLVIVVVMGIVTITTCYAELRQVPAALMRPVPPKGGQKSIFLERITPVWNHMSFTWKVTMRNLFRSKQRALMIIVGVAGCVALLVTGFGLRDSMNGVAEKQFTKIVKYDNMIVLKDDTTSLDADMQALLAKEDLQDALLMRQETFTSVAGNRNLQAYLVVPANKDNFRREFGLNDAATGKPLELSDSGFIVTNKFAELHGVGVGDTVTITDADDNSHTVPIAGIVENYMGHYLYASPAVYEEYLGEAATFNTIAVKNGPSTPEQKTLAQDLIDNDNILTVANNQDTLDQVASQNASIDMVVVLVVIIAALLAVVVLYNLTSINISERTREVATLKVLGFTDKETDSYIYRETFLLTLLAIFVGYGLGIALHGFAIGIISNEGIGLFKQVLWPTYIYSAVIVVVLAFVMQAITHFKLKAINMIDSLKSVE